MEGVSDRAYGGRRRQRGSIMKPMIQPSNPDNIVDLAQRQRVRVTYEKDDSIKFISHQDEFRAWERALRRADLLQSPAAHTIRIATGCRVFRYP